MKPITGTWQDSRGNLAAYGVLHARLNQDATVVQSNQVAPREVSFQLNAQGSLRPGATIWANDELSPAGTYYTLAVNAYGGGTIWGPVRLVLEGPGPINITAITPVSTIPPTMPVVNTSGGGGSFIGGMVDVAGNTWSVSQQMIIAGGSNIRLSGVTDGDSMSMSINAVPVSLSAGNTNITIQQLGNTATLWAGGGPGASVLITGGSNISVSSFSGGGGSSFTISVTNTSQFTTGISSWSSVESMSSMGVPLLVNGDNIVLASSLSGVNTLWGITGIAPAGGDTLYVNSQPFVGGIFGGHVAGETGANSSMVALAGGNNITLSGATNLNGMTVTISAANTSQVTSLTSALTSLSTADQLSSLATLDATAFTSLSQLTSMSNQSQVALAAGNTNVTVNSAVTAPNVVRYSVYGLATSQLTSMTTGLSSVSALQSLATLDAASLSNMVSLSNQSQISLVAGNTNATVNSGSTAPNLLRYSIYAPATTQLSGWTAGSSSLTNVASLTTALTSLSTADQLSSLATLDATAFTSLSQLVSLSNQSQISLVSGNAFITVNSGSTAPNLLRYSVYGQGTSHLTSMTTAMSSLTTGLASLANFTAGVTAATATTASNQFMLSFGGNMSNSRTTDTNGMTVYMQPQIQFGVAGGNASGTTGVNYLQRVNLYGGNNLTISQSGGSNFTFSAGLGNTASFVGGASSGGAGSFAGSSGMVTGNMVLYGGSNITLSQSLNTANSDSLGRYDSASLSIIGRPAMNIGVMMGGAGYTVGQTGMATRTQIYLYAGSNISLSSSGSSLNIGAKGAQFAIAAQGNMVTANNSIDSNGTTANISFDISQQGGGPNGASRYFAPAMPLIPTYETTLPMFPGGNSCVIWPLNPMPIGSNFSSAYMMSRFSWPAGFTGTATAAGSISMSLGFYVRNSNTLTRVSSGSSAWTWVVTANSNLTNYNQLKIMRIPFTGTNIPSFTDRDYWAGFCMSTFSAGQAFSADGVVCEGMASGDCAGFFGSSTALSFQRIPFWGLYSANVLPATVVLSQLTGTSATQMRVPIMWLGGWTA